MTHAQQLFMLFFAIIWGTVGNVQPRWKAFHYSLFFDHTPARRRFILSFFFFNVLPGLFFIFTFWALSTPKSYLVLDWRCFSKSFFPIFKLVLLGIIPAFSIFGFYRLWIAIIECAPNFFYSSSKEQIPRSFRDIEPYIGCKKLQLNYKSARKSKCKNILFGLIYVIFACFIPLLLR